MHKLWTDQAWESYLYWQTQDKRTLKRINELIKDIERNGALTGIGKPELLRNNLSGHYSRRIDDVNRLVYRIGNEATTTINPIPHKKKWRRIEAVPK